MAWATTSNRPCPLLRRMVAAGQLGAEEWARAFINTERHVKESPVPSPQSPVCVCLKIY